MKKSKLRLIQHCAEFLPRKDVKRVPKDVRGIYVLLQEKPREIGKPNLDVVYIGMSKTGVFSRLQAHARSARKSKLWTHFSVYSVWPNIRDEEIVELEGLFRVIFRKDSQANQIAVQKKYKELSEIRDDQFNWQ